jgi:hypothetical protein
LRKHKVKCRKKVKCGIEKKQNGVLEQCCFDKWAMCDKRRFDVRCGGWCDERRATCDARATIDTSTRDKKNSRSTKETFCQNTDSTNYPLVEKSV